LNRRVVDRQSGLVADNPQDRPIGILCLADIEVNYKTQNEQQASMDHFHTDLLKRQNWELIRPLKFRMLVSFPEDCQEFAKVDLASFGVFFRGLCSLITLPFALLLQLPREFKESRRTSTFASTSPMQIRTRELQRCPLPCHGERLFRLSK
jgi:hypothetical protein